MQFQTQKRSTFLIAILPLIVCSVVLAQTEKPGARLVDQFGDIQQSDLIARLDNLAVQVEQEPEAKAFLVVYRTRRDLPGLSNRYAHRMKSYLMRTRGLPAARIVTIDGGISGCLTQELWIVSPGAAPRPREDAYQNSYAPSIAKFDEHYFGDNEDGYFANEADDLLEAYGLELQKHPSSVAYLVAYRGLKESSKRSVPEVLRQERNFLIKEFRIKGNRIRTINGGFREWPTMELWVAYEPAAVPLIGSYRYVRRGR